MSKNRDKELLKKYKRSNTLGKSMGGSVFLDRDYSSVFKNKSAKNIAIFLCISPVLMGGVLLWLIELKIIALISFIAIFAIALMAIIGVKASR